jgi:PleD family two-component response regulator
MTPFALVIDDSRDIADSLCSMLDMFGLHARAVYGTRSAMLALEKITPTLVLLDLLMPGMTGFEVLSYVRREPRLSEVPVFIVSSENQRETVARALTEGATAFIRKPVSVDTLEAALKQAGLLT